jgi:hypothetical protein
MNKKWVVFMKRKKRKCNVIKAKTYFYITVSDGKKRIYKSKDKVKKYGNGRIMNPKFFSYVNLFINAVLQPNSSYKIKRDRLILKTKEIPEKGVPIILQFVKIYS